MTEFKIGDVVRLRTDGPNDLMLSIRGFNGDWAYCESKCLNRRQWEKLGDMELARPPDQQADLEQVTNEEKKQEMADFKVGDIVRLKTDEPERLPLILKEFDGDGALFRSECGRRCTWAAFDEVELIDRRDPQTDIKQAIREVLLSDEFMAKFAAAWMKTPLPIKEYPEPGEPTKAQQLAERTMKAIWQTNDGGNQ